MRQIALFLLFACATTACKRDPKEPPAVVMPYDGQYEIAMKEWTFSSGKELVFDMRTTELFGCTNYYIKVSDTNQPRSIVPDC